MDKCENAVGEIGVLVSGGFGAGWSTWNDNEEFLAMDKTLVEMRLRDAPESEVSAYCKKMVGEVPYMGGWEQVKVKWLDKGTAFTIDDYDGNESLLLTTCLQMST